MAKYRRTFSAGSKQVSTANQVIDFYNYQLKNQLNCNVQFFHFQTFDKPCHIKLNNEETVHMIAANSELIINDIDIDKFTIIDANVEFYYTAMTTE